MIGIVSGIFIFLSFFRLKFLYIYLFFSILTQSVSPFILLIHNEIPQSKFEIIEWIPTIKIMNQPIKIFDSSMWILVMIIWKEFIILLVNWNYGVNWENFGCGISHFLKKLSTWFSFVIYFPNAWHVFVQIAWKVHLEVILNLKMNLNKKIILNHDEIICLKS